MTDATRQSDEPILTADGILLKVSLARALRRKKLQALLLVAPLFLFIIINSAV